MKNQQRNQQYQQGNNNQNRGGNNWVRNNNQNTRNNNQRPQQRRPGLHPVCIHDLFNYFFIAKCKS